MTRDADRTGPGPRRSTRSTVDADASRRSTRLTVDPVTSRRSEADPDATCRSDGGSVAARDELAGVVDLFGALTRTELSRALSELAFKRRTETDEAAVEAAIDAGIAAYYLVDAPVDAVDPGDADAADPPDAGASTATVDEAADVLIAVGPAAFPTLPPNAEDLPHILDVPDRTVDRDRLAEAVLDQLRADATEAIVNGDADRLETLVDVTYDIEAWAPVDVAPVRDRIVDELDG